MLLALFGAVQFVPSVGVRDAAATALYPGGPDSPCFVNSYNNYPASCTRQLAYEACMTHNNYWKTHGSPNASGCQVTATVSGGAKGSYGSRLSSSQRIDYFNWGVSCPAGKTWDDASKTCFDPAVCLARNDDLGANRFKPRPSLTQSRCVAGCEFKMDTTTDYSATEGPGGESIYRGVMLYTGNSCTASPTSPDGTEDAQKTIPPQECVAVGTQTMCKKPDGSFCATASTGRQICWRAGEVGEKSDGPVLQVRNAGALPSSPVTTPPTGDTFTQQGAPLTTTETGTAGTITTTTTNYVTSSGVDASPNQSGEASDGTGSAGGTGSGDSEANGLLGEIRDKLGEIKDSIVGDGSGVDDATGLDATAESVMSEQEYGAEGFDQSGFGYSRTCPAPPSVEIQGRTFTFDADGLFCDWITAGGWFVIMIAGIACMRIVVGGKS